jgi:hypothetical protein
MWHGIIVDKSLKDAKIIDAMKVLSSKDTPDGWKLYKVEIEDSTLQDTIKTIQHNISATSWYAHFYSQDGMKIIVVFRNQIFEMVNNPSFWKPAIKYGKLVGIPENQIDFKPSKFEEEDF